MATRIVLLTILLVLGVSHIPHFNKQQISNKIGQTVVMYGSTIRIRGIASNHHLHSHEVRYPRGSGFQSVTGMSHDNDYNSLWTIKEPHGEQIALYDESVKCGDTVRLEHALTKRNLHSESIFMSMITEGQEVSAFGNDGFGDQNDNWVIRCQSQKDGQELTGASTFELVHENTDRRLKMSRYYKYVFSNWENCPCDGQLQVSGVASGTRQTIFQVVGGIFIKAPKNTASNAQEQNGEL